MFKFEAIIKAKINICYVEMKNLYIANPVEMKNLTFGSLS